MGVGGGGEEVDLNNCHVMNNRFKGSLLVLEQVNARGMGLKCGTASKKYATMYS